MHIDPPPGGPHALKDLVPDAPDARLKPVLARGCHHTSNEHSWFQDIRQKGAKSEFFNRYYVNHWPIRYSRDDQGVLRSPDYGSWWGYATLPELQTTKPEVRDYFLTGKDSVVKHWI